MDVEHTVIDIPNGPEVNYLIGSRGSGVNGLQDLTGTRIQIQRPNEVPAGSLVRTVTISGGEAQRSECARLILAKVQECQERDKARINGKRKLDDGVASVGAPGAAFTGMLPILPQQLLPAAVPAMPQVAWQQHVPQQENIQIPNGPAVNYLIGTKGAGINALQELTGTRIKIQPIQEVPLGATMRVVTIVGGEMQRAQCAQMIQQKIFECQQRDQARAAALAPTGAGPMGISALPGGMGGYGGLGLPPFNSLGGMLPPPSGGMLPPPSGGMPMWGDHTETTIEIPNGPEVNYLIGTKGAGVKALQESTGTRIQIQRIQDVPAGATRRSVTISGGDATRQNNCAQLIQHKVLECQQRDLARVNAGGGMLGGGMSGPQAVGQGPVN